MNFAEIYDEISPSVIVVINGQSIGTGFFIDKGGYIATAGHVVLGSQMVEIITPTSSPNTVQAKVIKINQQLDIAILKVETNEDISCVELGDSSSVNIGDEIVFLGFPFGKTIWGIFLPAIHRGIISNIVKLIDQTTSNVTKRFQLDAMVNTGNSGGPLALNKNGKVIGIITSTLLEKPFGDSLTVGGRAITTPTGIGMSIPIDFVKEMLKDEISSKL